MARRGRKSVHDELYSAILAMEVGDPPLRWTLTESRVHTVRASLQRHASLVRAGVRVWTNYYEGQLWIVRYA